MASRDYEYDRERDRGRERERDYDKGYDRGYDREYDRGYERGRDRESRRDEYEQRGGGRDRERERSGDRMERVSLLVRNLPLDTRTEDIKGKFERYGEIRDVYLPRDYYTQRLRGFGFVEFRDPRDAEDAMRGLHKSIFNGKEISVVLSKEARKTPREMKQREDEYVRTRDTSSHRRSRSRSPYRNGGGSNRSYSRGHSYSRSPPPPRRERRYSRSPVRGDASPRD